LTVYLPEDLSARVRARGESPSSLVQKALRQLLSEDRSPTYAPPPSANKRLGEAAANLAKQARDQYAAGYEAAVSRLPDLSWELLDTWAETGYSLVLDRKWFDQLEGQSDQGWDFRDAGPHEQQTQWIGLVANDLADFDSQAEVYVAKSRTFRRGYADALRDTFEAVEKATTEGQEGEGAR
jgi:hypothetical protein